MTLKLVVERYSPCRMGKPLYLTTTLPYVNADPHIGFALELVHADILARYAALRGREVFFNTGTDEHGLKVFRKAREEGKEPQAYTDERAAKFRKLNKALGLFPDIHFIRTTDSHHKEAAQELWGRCAAAGDIYKKRYKGLYCVGDEAFVRESELVGGRCPNHPTMALEEIEEENYFFRLSRYQERLEEYLSREGVVVPEWRQKEALRFVRQGLEDFSISREKSRLPWGVPVPGDDTQTMYVWFDALTNYISTLGWPKDERGHFKKFWIGGETLQLAGKDQVRFQSIMWQAMLMSAGLPTTARVVYHGFITSGGQKMSKSIGNVADPFEIINEYGTDALRYFLARHIHPFEDSDFTHMRFREAYNADLANGLGNVVSRVMKLAADNLPEPFQPPEGTTVPSDVNRALESFEPHNALDHVWHMIAGIDSKITFERPFEVVRRDLARGRAKIKTLVALLWTVMAALEPFMPETAEKVMKAIRENRKPDNLFPRRS